MWLINSYMCMFLNYLRNIWCNHLIVCVDILVTRERRVGTLLSTVWLWNKLEPHVKWGTSSYSMMFLFVPDRKCQSGLWFRICWLTRDVLVPCWVRSDCGTSWNFTSVAQFCHHVSMFMCNDTYTIHLPNLCQCKSKLPNSCLFFCEYYASFENLINILWK